MLVEQGMDFDEQELSKQFKVFHDPTFAEFIEIVGVSINPELPLFAQLYILKQISLFYHVAWNKGFLYYLSANLFF